MIVENQDEVIEYLSAAHNYGLTGAVETLETHISRIFLVGDRAFKLKRSVKLPYVDFSTAALRLDACQKEIRFNGPSAPDLYLGVRQIRRGADGRLGFGVGGTLVDSVVEMVRFDQDLIADSLAVSGGLSPDLMTRIAATIARFHQTAPTVHASAGSANIAGVLAINEAGFATSTIFMPGAIAFLCKTFREQLAVHSDRLDRREAAGKVRRCHGDLHLRNICVLHGKPTLFDCIEFNDQIATVDTLYDLAFLLMDLWHRGLKQHANLVANRYLDQSDNDDGFVLLPFFMAVRAAVRAHVTATQAEQNGHGSSSLIQEAHSYFSLAQELLGVTQPMLVAIGGLSGSGKTTLADALAPMIGSPPGARVLESDRLRKALHGVDAETRLPASAYSPENSERVYKEMAIRAGAILADGGAVVVDAVFDRLADRERIEGTAHAHKASFSSVWLEADADLLRHRVSTRLSGPSDADLSVLSRQLENRHGDTGWPILDASRPVTLLVNEAMKRTNQLQFIKS